MKNNAGNDRHRRGGSPLWVAAILATAILAVGGMGCSTVRSLFRQPYDLTDPKQARRAVEELQLAVAARPEDAGLIGRLAVAFYFAGESDSAAARASEALSMEPLEANAVFARALLLESKGRYAQAESLYAVRGQLVGLSRRLERTMASRQAILARRLLRERLRKDLEAAAAGAAAPIDPWTMLVEPFRGLGGHQDSVIATGVTYFLTNAFAQVGGLTVVDYSRSSLLSDEIRRSRRWTASERTRLTRKVVGAGLALGGHVGREGSQVRVAYKIEDFIAGPGEDGYRGTDLIEVTPTVKYLLEDLGKAVVQVCEDRLGLKLDPATKEKLQKPPTRSFAAFLAASEGLLWEQQGQYGKALASYREAALLDPGFSWAEDGSERVAGAGEKGEPIAPDATPPSGESTQGKIGEETIEAVDDLPGHLPAPGADVPLERQTRVHVIVHPVEP